jgi:hypothetical protein
MRTLCNWLRSRRALSPIFATVLLASIIIIFGTVAYYYSTNLTTTATNNYSNQLSSSQQAVGERIGFENVVYSSYPAKLTVYIINSGSSNNIQIDSAFIYDSSQNLVGIFSASSPNSISSLIPIDSSGPSPSPIASLNVGKEAYFTLIENTSGNNISLTPGSIYTIHLITKSGSAFEYEFAP